MSDLTTIQRISRVQRRVPILQLVALVALFVYGATTIDSFSSSSSIRSMLVLAAITGFAAAGQTLVMIVGGLDLSISGYISAAAIILAQLCGAHGWGFLAAFAFILVVFAALGGLAGFICHRFMLQPLIVTLGLGSAALGACVAWTGGQITGSAPAFLSEITAANGTTLGIEVPPVVVIWAAVAVALAVFLHRTVAGRRVYETGANPRAAGLALVPTRAVWIGVFAASAIFSALAGVLLAGFSGADQTVGDPFFFQGLTAVIVGGTTVMGSRGDYTHTVVGALILTVLGTVLVGKGYDSADQQIIFGVLIVAVVATYGREARLRDRI